MKKKTTRLLTAALALVMCLALAACGNTGSGSDALPEAGDCLDPNELEWGYDAPGTAVMDTEHWYPDGDKTLSRYLFFEDDCLTVVDGGEPEYIRTEIVEQHLVDAETGGSAYDFLFVDAFTCCDLVSGQWYARADYDAVLRSLTSVTWVTGSEGQWKYHFYEDGTMSYDDNGTTQTGTWRMEEAHLIDTHFDDEAEGYGGWMNIAYADESWDIVSLQDTDYWYPEA